MRRATNQQVPRASAAVALIVPLLACAWAWAHTAPPAAAAVETAPAASTEGEVIEDIGAVQDVTATASQPKASDLTLLQIIGRMHPAAVHLPIGWILLLTLWELFVVLTRQRELESVGLYLGVGAALSTVPAIATGLLRAGQLPEDPATLDAIHDHRNIMFGATTVLVGAVLVRFCRRQGPLAGRRRIVYVALLMVASVLVGLGGHWGGKLVFGDNYLPF
jgi:uncharacterized membrane protein